MAKRKKFKDDAVGTRRQELLAAQRAADRDPTRPNIQQRISAEKALLRAINLRKKRKGEKV